MYNDRRRAAYLIAIVFIAIFVAAAFRGDTGPPVQEDGVSATVNRVIDGDTFDIVGGARVRLIGIDTPERGEPGYEEATERLTKLILTKTVTLVTDTTDKDEFNRLLRYVYVDDVFVNEVLVREGLARQFPYGEDRMFEGLFAEAEQSAEAASLGIWAK